MRFDCLAAALLLAPAVAHSGVVETVQFDPATQFILAGERATFDVYLNTVTLGDIQGADILFGSNDVTFSFAYSDEWQAAMQNVSPSEPVDLFYDYALYAGGNNPPGPIGATRILFGTIDMETQTLAPGESATVMVDSELDGGISQILLSLFGEPAIGSAVGIATVTVVPEPSVVVLLLGGGALALRRRR